MSEQGMRGRRGGGRPVRGSGSGGGADEVADIQPPSASAVTSKLRRGRSATRTCHHPDNSAEGVGNAEEVEASTALLGLAGAPVGVPGVGQQQAGENGVRGKRACSIPRGHWTPPKRARKGVSSPPGARDPGELPNAKRRLVTTSAGAARSAAAGSSRRSVTARRSVADSDGKRPPLHPDARARGNTGNGKGKGKAPAEKSNASSAARPASATSPKKGSKTHKKKGCTNKEWEEEAGPRDKNWTWYSKEKTALLRCFASSGSRGLPYGTQNPVLKQTNQRGFNAWLRFILEEVVASLQADKEHRVPDKLVRDKFTAACNYVHIKNWLASQRERYAKHQALKNQPGTGSAANDDETTNPLHLAWQEAFGGSAASTMGTNPFESGGSSETPAASAEAPAPPGSAATPPGAGDDDGCGIPDLAPLCRCAEDCTLAAGKGGDAGKHFWSCAKRECHFSEMAVDGLAASLAFNPGVAEVAEEGEDEDSNEDGAGGGGGGEDDFGLEDDTAEAGFSQSPKKDVVALTPTTKKKQAVRKERGRQKPAAPFSSASVEEVIKGGKKDVAGVTELLSSSVMSMVDAVKGMAGNQGGGAGGGAGSGSGGASKVAAEPTNLEKTEAAKVNQGFLALQMQMRKEMPEGEKGITWEEMRKTMDGCRVDLR